MKKYTLKKLVFKDLPDGGYSGLAFITKVFFDTPFILDRRLTLPDCTCSSDQYLQWLQGFSARFVLFLREKRYCVPVRCEYILLTAIVELFQGGGPPGFYQTW
jgi:hypothetical protein